VSGLEAEKFANERRFELEEQKRQLIFESALTKSLNATSAGVAGLLQSAIFDFET